MSAIYTPALLEKGLRTELLMTAAQAPAPIYVGTIATVVPSNASSEKYAWLGEAPMMAAVDDEVEFTPLSEATYEVTNQLYSAALKISRAMLEDDQTGAIRMRWNQLIRVGLKHPDKLVLNAVTSGTTELGYDGVAFFSASHPARGQLTSTQSNLVTQTGTSTATAAADINSAITRMSTFLAENGEPYHDMLNRFVIVAPVAMRQWIKEAVTAQLVSNTSNVVFSGDDIKLIFDGRLDAVSASDFYVFHVGGGTLPILLQERRALEMVVQEAQSDDGFLREEWNAKVSARRRAGYAAWQNAIKVA